MTDALNDLGDDADWRPKAKIVRPTVIDDVLVNPGIGFMTFQRFNGDKLNEGTGWIEGHPIEYQPWEGKLETPGHPMTSLAYLRLYWKYLETREGHYEWELIDKALETAERRGQTLLIRIAPYGTKTKDKDNDVPAWYREKVGAEGEMHKSWRTSAENPLYAKSFGRMVQALGERYNGDCRLESVDLSIVGLWGEGAGSDELTEKTRRALVDAYVEAFPDKHLIMLLTDKATNGYALSRRPMGWRVDCLGDLGGFNLYWNHMYDYYPQMIIESGMRDAWMKAPVSLEVCWVIKHWKDKGWDVDYMIDQSLKWHISSFNGKSSAVPEEWKPNVDRWLKRMGYRLALRKLAYMPKVKLWEKMSFTTWWENLGVAPPYHRFRFAFRLKRKDFKSAAMVTAGDVREWLPGDALCNGEVALPAGVERGEYELQVGLLGVSGEQPAVRLAIAGREEDGWYTMGKVEVE